MSSNQRQDMVVLAHIRDQFTQSLGSYGRSRMTEELKELGLEKHLEGTAEELQKFTRNYADFKNYPMDKLTP